MAYVLGSDDAGIETRDDNVDDVVVVASFVAHREPKEKSDDMGSGRDSGLLCPLRFLDRTMASSFLLLRSTASCRTPSCSSTRGIATSVRVLARTAGGTPTKKYGKGGEPKKKKKLSPEAEMRLQRQRAKKVYDVNAYKMTLEDAINVIRVHAKWTWYSLQQEPDGATLVV
jgi:hypothetical protein